jgi:hypothetical protein
MEGWMFGLKKYDTNPVHDAITALLYEEKQRLQFTPDYHDIGTRRGNLVFVHDDMMMLQPNHDLVKDGLSWFYPFAYGYTSQKFSFVKKELGLKSFPIAIDLRNTDDMPMHVAQTYRIRGELYALRPQTIIELDTHRQNGVQFQRIKVNINVASRKLRRSVWTDANGRDKSEYKLGKEEMITVPCWMYVGREAYWKDQLESQFFDFKSIDIVQEDRLWLKEYYQYNRR